VLHVCAPSHCPEPAPSDGPCKLSQEGRGRGRKSGAYVGSLLRHVDDRLTELMWCICICCFAGMYEGEWEVRGLKR
jgi:hypothetical protein